MSEPAVDMSTETSTETASTEQTVDQGTTQTSEPSKTTLIDGAPAEDQKDSPNESSSDSSADEGKETLENGDKPKSADESDSKDSDSKDDKDGAKDNVYELQLPEGSKLSQPEVEEVTSFAKEHGFSQEQAQAILEFQSKVNGQIMENAQTLVLEQAEKTNQANADKWLVEVKDHPELGGDNFKATAEKMKRFSDAYVPQEMKDFLNQTGYGNNPAVAQLFSKLYDELGLGEDSTVHGSTGQSKSNKSRAERLYGEGTEVDPHANG